MSYALIQLKMVVLIILEIGSKNPVLLERVTSFLVSDSKSKRYIIYHSIKEGDYTATKWGSGKVFTVKNQVSILCRQIMVHGRNTVRYRNE